MVALCKAFNAFDPLTKDVSASRNLAHQQVVQALRQRKKFLSQGWTFTGNGATTCCLQYCVKRGGNSASLMFQSVPA